MEKGIFKQEVDNFKEAKETFENCYDKIVEITKFKPEFPHEGRELREVLGILFHAGTVKQIKDRTLLTLTRKEKN